MLKFINILLAVEEQHVQLMICEETFFACKFFEFASLKMHHYSSYVCEGMSHVCVLLYMYEDSMCIYSH